MQASSFASSHPPPVYLPPTFNRILSYTHHFTNMLTLTSTTLSVFWTNHPSLKMALNNEHMNSPTKMFKKLGRTNVSQQSAPPNVSQLQWPRNFEATFEAGPPVFSQSFFLSFLDLLCRRSRNRGISVSRPFSLVLRPFCSCQTLKCDQMWRMIF